jgi:endonuclease G, mitochondrial
MAGLDHSAFLRHLARGEDVTWLMSDKMLEREESVRSASTESAAMLPDVRGAL